MFLIPNFNKIFDDDFFGIPSRPLYSPMPLMRSVESNTNVTLRHSSPCYEVHEHDRKFQFSLDVPGVKLEDITVQFEQNVFFCCW